MKKKDKNNELLNALRSISPVIAVSGRTLIPELEGHRPAFSGRVILSLKKLQEANHNDLGKDLNVDPIYLRNAIRWGREKELIEMTADGDLPVYGLTKKGLALADQIECSLDGLAKLVDETLTPEEQAAAASALAKLQSATEKSYPQIRKILNLHLSQPMEERQPVVDAPRCNPRQDLGILDLDEDFSMEDFEFDPEELGFEVCPKVACKAVMLFFMAKLVKSVSERGSAELQQALRHVLQSKLQEKSFDLNSLDLQLTPAQVRRIVELFDQKREMEKARKLQKTKAKAIKKYLKRALFQKFLEEYS